ncbi:MAG: universal stress protein [Hymenobacteraceae bacterium]|nr:universal stress protein [Hymenobacteraceae bacterium]MDX5396640.1 universal stress protein [Hymenobacteraceae bacterium]MDX5512707.1 universal stress protein [Hymenobacteraceae bacterium]
MKKIICPTDFSPTAEKAIKYAALIAQKAKAHLTLLHVIHLPIVDTSETALVASELLGEQRRDATDRLKSACGRLEQELGSLYSTGWSCDFRVEEALLTDMVENMVKEEGYDMVIMGTTGAGGKLEEILIGSNAEAIMENVKCPVLAIPANAAPPRIQRIVYASDYQDNDGLALQEVAELASIFQASIEVLHVCEDRENLNSERAREFRQSLQQELPGLPLQFHEIVNDNEEKGLKEYLNQQNADMLAILRKRKNFFRDLFRQSLTEKMTYHARLPLLIVHGKNR